MVDYFNKLDSHLYYESITRCNCDWIDGNGAWPHFKRRIEAILLDFIIRCIASYDLFRIKPATRDLYWIIRRLLFTEMSSCRRYRRSTGCTSSDESQDVALFVGHEVISQSVRKVKTDLPAGSSYACRTSTGCGGVSVRHRTWRFLADVPLYFAFRISGIV